MGEHVNNIYCVLSIAFVLAHVCIWSSLAEDDFKSVKYPVNDEKRSVPQVVLARTSPEEHDPIIFLHDHDHDQDHEYDRYPYPGDKDREDKHVEESSANYSPEIPLNLIQRINSIENITELQSLLNYGDIEIGNRFGNDELDSIEKKGAVMPKPAGCKPELVTVPLHNSEDKSVFYYPACTRVERCGGCCSHELLSCQPVATEMVNYQVIVTKFEGGAKLNYKGKEIVTVEQHVKCKCDCKLKESDCNSLQEYEKSECRCVCLNVDEEQKCIQENDTKLWDPNECICACRQTKECSTGYYFDHKTCGCSPVPIIRRRGANPDPEIRYRRGGNNSYKYRLSPRPIVPLAKDENKSND